MLNSTQRCIGFANEFSDLDSAITLFHLLLPNNSHTPNLLSFLRQVSLILIITQRKQI
jgi:hypothetical protein